MSGNDKSEPPGFKFGLAAASDLLGLLGVPTSLVATTLERVVQGRRMKARQILETQLKGARLANPTEADVDAFAAAFARYARAAEEGTLAQNLAIMARAIRGMIEAGAVDEAEFLAISNAVEDLDKRQILLLASLYRHSRHAQESVGKIDPQTTYGLVQSELVPSVFDDPFEMHASASAATKSGLIAPYLILAITPGRPSTYILTEKLMRLGDLISLDTFVAELDVSES